MKRLVLLLLIGLLLFSSFCFAEETLVLHATLSVQDNVVEVDEVYTIYGNVTESNPNGDMIAVLLDKDTEPIYQIKFDIEEFYPTIPDSVPEGGIENWNESVGVIREVELQFPYFKEAEIIEIGYQGNAPIAFVGIKDEICNLDGECGGNENFLSCEADCSIEEDLYCYPETDGICDSDCIEGLDEDCDGTEKPGAEESEFNLQEYFVPIAIFLIAGLIIGYNLIKRK